MEIKKDLISKILKQLDDEYPDAVRSTTEMLPNHQDREEIRKHLIYLGDKNQITFREGMGARDVKPLLFNIRKVPD